MYCRDTYLSDADQSDSPVLAWVLDGGRVMVNETSWSARSLGSVSVATGLTVSRM